MKVFLIALLCFLPSAVSSLAESSFGEWLKWKRFHKVNYGNIEDRVRLRIFMENKAVIDDHNAAAHRGEKSYFLKMNSYGDLTHDEFIKAMYGYNFALEQNQTHDGALTYITPHYGNLPREVNWTARGAVTAVKDEGRHCLACWAFSATGALEGQHFQKTGKLVSLSEQNLIDCSGKQGNAGCYGGNMYKSFNYVKENGGIDTEKSYPYEFYGGPCRYNPKNIGATDKGFRLLKPYDEEVLKGAVATVGPVSVAIDARGRPFQFYSHGIYNNPNCSEDDANLGVLVVGYGTTENVDYWLVKNSLSAYWGIDGYIKMSRNKDNQCCIATEGIYPVV